MNVGIIDADLIDKKKHRFPNLASMKLSGYHKELCDNVSLLLDYNNISDFDKVYISKVFTDTKVPEDILKLKNVEYGGTGFYYDKAPQLSYEIEHHMPDYHLYDEWVNKQLENGGKRLDFKYYLDYSIGFVTRGCFRQCEFCVNKNQKKVELHSSLEEFVDQSRKKICLLDDNFFGCSKWKDILLQLQATNKPFQFKQGLDERLLTDEKCELLFKSKYDGDYIFAFDNIEDKDVIEKKAYLIRKYNKNLGQNFKFYVLCGFDRNNKYDLNFWKQDINDTFERIFILSKYNFKSYIMRFEKYQESPLYGTYVNIACWCNQPSLFNNLSYKQFCEKDDLRKSGGKGSSATWRYLEQMLDLNLECNKYINAVPKSVKEDYSNW